MNQDSNPEDENTVPGGDLDDVLAAIEERPLAERAAAYTQVHDRLRDQLEGGDAPRPADG